MAGPRRRFASAGQTVSGAGAGRAGGSRIVDVRHFVAGIRREVAAGWSTGSRGRRAAILLGGTLTAALAGAVLFGAWHVLFGGFVKGNWRAGGFGVVLASFSAALLAGEAALARRLLS